MARTSMFSRGNALAGAALLASIVTVKSLPAASLPHYDLDSLIFLSSEIVEGRLASSLQPLGPAQAGRRAANTIEVDAVYKGGFARGDQIQLTGLGHYELDGGEGEPPEFLKEGDHVFLFLHRAREDRSVSQARDAKGSKEPQRYETVWSGVKLVEEDQVAGFFQYKGDFGPYFPATQGPFAKEQLPLPEFRAVLRSRVEQITPVEEWFRAEVSKQEIPRLLDLLRERRQPRPKVLQNFFQQDAIAEQARGRLARIQEPDALDQALHISGFDSYTLAGGFGTPEGLDFVLKRIAASETPLETRVRYARVLRNAVRSYYWRLQPEKPAEGIYLTRIANLARDEALNEPLCLSLLECIGQLARIQPEEQKVRFSREWDQVVTTLADLFERTSSERIRFHVETALAAYRPEAHAKWGFRSASIISILERSEPTRYPAPWPRGLIGYKYQVIRIGAVGFRKAEVIAEHVDTGRIYTRVLDTNPFVPEMGTGSILLSQDAPAGRYRVYPRFLSGEGRIISIGHGFEEEL